MKIIAYCLMVFLVCLTVQASDPKTIVARIFDREITAAEIGLEFDAKGNPILPTDPATCLKTNSLAELQKIILREMQRETVSAQNLGATDAELAEMAEFQEKSMARERVRHREDLEKFEQQLAEGGLSPEEQERVEQRLKTLRSLAEHDKRLETMPKPTPEMLRMIHAPFVEAWKYHKAIYAEFGGVVASTKFGPDPVGAKAALAAKLEQEGKLEILNRTLREALWANLNSSPRYLVEANDVDFTPFWKLPLPQDDPAVPTQTTNP
jgi:hypothetical protein